LLWNILDHLGYNSAYRNIVMYNQRLAAAASFIVVSSLFIATSLQPCVFAQRRTAPPQRERGFHASVHGDLKETYVSDRHEADLNDHSEQELTVKYDIDKDFRYDGQELLEVPGQSANAGGSFHAKADTQTSARDLHEHYQMDTAGSILEGGIDFLHGTSEQRINVANTDGVLQSCKSEGNVESATDDCGVVTLSDISFHEYDKGKVVTLDHSVDAHPLSARPRDLSPELGYVSNDWYGAVAQGSEATGFTVTLEAKKSLAPPVTQDGYKVTQEKTLVLSIKVSPSGLKSQIVPLLAPNDTSTMDLTALLDPKYSPLAAPAALPDR